MHLKTLCRLTLAVALAAGGAAHAALVPTDFWSAGDRLLVQDDTTGREWLSPVATSNHAWGDALIQGLFSQGFRYASRAEVLDLIDDNFGLPTSDLPGDAAGFAIAQQFFDVFGVAEKVRCQSASGWLNCPRTQGLTADAGQPGTHIAVGLIQWGSNGYLLDNNAWFDGSKDVQLGSWLVRTHAAQALPEPGSLALLMAAGLGAAWVRRRRKPLGNLA